MRSSFVVQPISSMSPVSLFTRGFNMGNISSRDSRWGLRIMNYRMVSTNRRAMETMPMTWYCKCKRTMENIVSFAKSTLVEARRGKFNKTILRNIRGGCRNGGHDREDDGLQELVQAVVEGEGRPHLPSTSCP